MPLRHRVSLLFFLSGFCGLLYQVIWVRLAFIHFGVITPVLSVVVSVFMLGLAIGSWAAGRWTASWTKALRTSAITLYGFSELLIGISAFAVPWLFAQGETWLLPGGEMNSTSYLVSSAWIMTATLLPWCIAMGATYPLMTAFLKEQDHADTSSFSRLYLANVIGAVMGTILTADVFVELLGFRHTLAIAGSLNFLIAAVSLAMGRQFSRRKTIASTAEVRLEDRTASGQERRSLLGLILFTTGLASMALEVVWTRAFTPVLNTTIYAFALILAVYLTATALGSYLYRRDLAKGKAATTPALMAALAVSSFLPVVLNDPRLDLRTLGVELGIFPLCLCLGYLTPKLIDQYAQGFAEKVGRAYAVNVVGCIIGPVFASYILLPAFGVKISMVLLALPFLLFWGIGARRAFRWKRPAAVATAAFFVCSVFINISYEEKYAQGVVRRDPTATVISAGTGMDKRLYVNGQGITTLSTITKEMAHMPLAYIPGKPVSALDICFGMGATYRSLMSWNIQVTAVELVPSVRDAFGYYFDDANRILQNPAGRIVIDDGRRFLKRTSQTFDVVTIDPPPPIEAAASSLLYSVEFYGLVKERLKPAGILQQWFPGGEGAECRAIARSIVESFPYVKAYRSSAGEGIHFLASLRPLEPLTAKQLAAKIPPAAQKDFVEWETGGVPSVLQRILVQELSMETLLGNDPTVRISDDRPYNEYYLLRRSWARFLRIYHK
jgi:spermidine synthase